MTSLVSKAIIFSFIVVKEESEELSYSMLKQLLCKVFQKNKTFETGDLLDALEKRALYPLVHYNLKPMNEIEEIQLLKPSGLGEEFLLRQGVYVESKNYQLPRHIKDSNHKNGIAYIFMGFKSVDLSYNENLEESWKDWTGARLVNTCLRKEFYIRRYSFFHRIHPPDPELFMYILIIECHNVDNINVTYLLDFVQKLRVERVFGYLTVYKRESLSSTSALIKGLLSEQEEYGDFSKNGGGGRWIIKHLKK